MESRINEVTMHYIEHGRGVPVVGPFCTVWALIIARSRRRSRPSFPAPPPDYPDLPGMGSSTTEGLTSNNNVVSLLVDLIEAWSPPCCRVTGIERLTQQLKSTHGPGSDLVRGTADSAGGRNTHGFLRYRHGG
jgi:hypothetical protein